MAGPANFLSDAQRCCYGAAADYCGQRAAMHVWLHDDLGSMSCAEHADWWETHPHSDRHPISGACGLPDTVWMFATEDRPGMCVIEGLEDLALVELAEAIA